MTSPKDKIIEALGVGRSFIVLGHVDPDGDCLGSMLALSTYLSEQAGKRVFVPAPRFWPARYGFLEKYRNGNGKPIETDVDTVVILDCSTDDRVDWGDLDQTDFNDKTHIVLDHHREGLPFGELNWIDPDAASVGELVYEILKAFDAKITPAIAESLYCAIVTDTGRFTFNNTGENSLRVCAELVAKGGINPSEITKKLYANISEEYLRNIGIALYNSRTYEDARIVLLTLDKASVKSFSTTFDETEGIVDLAMSVRGAEVAALFKEIERNMIHVSLRSRGAIDVGAIAASLGGGGHRNAAGCTLGMPLSLAREIVLDRFGTALLDAEKKGEFVRS
jgi:phosphoesterase RecJ-like protein